MFNANPHFVYPSWNTLHLLIPRSRLLLQSLTWHSSLICVSITTLLPERDFLRGLGLLSKDRLSLATVSLLLNLVPSLALCSLASGRFFVLSDLVQSVLFAFLAVCSLSLRHVDH